MDKIKVGLPRSIFYYYYGSLWQKILKQMNCEIVVSPITNKQIMELGAKYANDEMCVSMKNYIGHIAYLQDKCDYILVPRIDNYGIDNQTCTNFLAAYDIVHNLFPVKILNYNIDVANNETEEKAMIELGMKLGHSKQFCRRIYNEVKEADENEKEKHIQQNMAKLRSKKTKILVVGHPYNLYDAYIGSPIIKYLEKQKVEIIYSDKFNSYMTNKISKSLSSELYFKYSKENIGAIALTQNIVDGIIFITSFPCGPDSLANELVMRKLKVPYLNLIVDDMDASAGVETRLESFLDIVERKHIHE